MTHPPILPETLIRRLIGPPDALRAVRDAFVRHAGGQSALAKPIGFEVTPTGGEVHVKAAHLHGDAIYTVKIASGFYQNASRGLPVSNGLMVAFDAYTGGLIAILMDNGYLTELRTAAAGALAADLLARSDVQRVGVIGCGTQARYQLEALRVVRQFRQVVAFGRTDAHARAFASEMSSRLDLEVRIVGSAREAVVSSDIVVTTTPSHQPLVMAEWLNPGTHVTAVGSDAPGKQELDSGVLRRADKVVADSYEQCLRLGELQHVPELAIHAELGELAAGLKVGRTSASEITVADLTGLGIQDTAVACAVVQKAGERCK